ncbi:tetratricopeptide repeat protein [Telmatobacter sp. DSM 110680]|uniref:Tetratricopeptide repeat protein n=1 Tax=Telmatobacter sp. DSM 110680 TaxID=3036704 RepID=A0AAU7DKG3_9BACT
MAFCPSVCHVSMAQQKSAKASDDFEQAATLAQQGRVAEAKTATLEALQKHPSSVEGYNLLGIIDTNQHDYSSALEAFKKALQIAPKSVKTYNNIGNAYVAMKNLDSAEKAFRMGLRLDPGNQDGNYNLGVLMMMKGDALGAIPHFEKVNTRKIAARFNLIRAYFETRRVEDALRIAREVSTQGQDDVQVHFSLGVLLASQKQYKAAQLELEKADSLQPETFEIIYNLGQVYLREGENSKSELALSRAMKLKPDSVETMYMSAQAYTNESRPLDALDLLLRAHKLAPENVDVIFLMAQISMSQNYFEDAIPLLESGIQIAPQRADLVAALGESYFMAGKVDKAIDQFTKLLKIENSARSYSFLGLSYRNLGRFDEAKKYFEAGIKLDPHSTLCLFNLGFIAERQGDAAGAENYFQQALRFNPDFSDALLELANLRMAAKKLPEAVELLRRYVRVSRDPANGYYKLAMAERSLHETAAADRDLNSFKTMSKNSSSGPLPFENLFNYLNNRSTLAPGARSQLDLAELTNEVKKHPDQPENLYLLAEAYLKTGDVAAARSTIAQLDQLGNEDFRTLAGIGVLLARFHLYDDAIEHFQRGLQTNPDSDDLKFDLANAYFRKREYSHALDVAQGVSPDEHKDDAYLALLGDIYAHMGNAEAAQKIFEDEIARNPDDDQAYLSLALMNLRIGNIDEARRILQKGQKRIPGSGKLYWGLGLTAALLGNSKDAAENLERSVDLLPEWAGGYSTLGVFYFETGQIGKAREVLDRFRNSSANASLDIERIAQVLDQAAPANVAEKEPTNLADKAQFLQLALSLADRTL